MRIIGRRLSQRLVATDTDEVIAGYPLPSGGRLNGVNLTVHAIGPEQTPFLNAVFYGIAGFVMPANDPDSSETYENLWDRLVPKDKQLAAGGFELDTGSADTQPEFELGDVDYSGVFQMAGLSPIEIFKRRRMLTAASGGPYEAVSSSGDMYTPMDKFTTKVNRKVSTAMPSICMFGFSSPDTARTVSVEMDIPEEHEWVLLQYVEVALENAFMHLIGLTEAGSETPYEESSAFLSELLELVFEETAGSFRPVSWTVFTQATFDISVPGNLSFGALTSD